MMDLKFENETFDYVIDKATIDVLFVDRKKYILILFYTFIKQFF